MENKIFKEEYFSAIMINKTFIKKIAEKRDKKIGISAIKKIEKILQEKVEKLLIKASKQADFLGRKIIKSEDIAEIEERIEDVL